MNAEDFRSEELTLFRTTRSGTSCHFLLEEDHCESAGADACYLRSVFPSVYDHQPPAGYYEIIQQYLTNSFHALYEPYSRVSSP